MNWYKKAQDEQESRLGKFEQNEFDLKHIKKPKGWGVSVKKDPASNMYVVSIWKDHRLYTYIPTMFNYRDEARLNGWKWLNWQLSLSDNSNKK